MSGPKRVPSNAPVQPPFTLTETVLGRIRHSSWQPMWIALSGIASAHSFTAAFWSSARTLSKSCRSCPRFPAGGRRAGRAPKRNLRRASGRVDVHVLPLPAECGGTGPEVDWLHPTSRPMSSSSLDRSLPPATPARVQLGKHRLGAARPCRMGWEGETAWTVLCALPARLWQSARRNGGNGLSRGAQVGRRDQTAWTGR
jgi:hypothetical protein